MAHKTKQKSSETFERNLKWRGAPKHRKKNGASKAPYCCNVVNNLPCLTMHASQRIVFSCVEFTILTENRYVNTNEIDIIACFFLLISES